MNCPGCDKEIQGFETFCPHCGVPLSSEAPFPVAPPPTRKTSPWRYVLIIALLIIGIIVAIVLTDSSSVGNLIRERKKVIDCTTALGSIKTAQELYIQNYDEYADSLEALARENLIDMEKVDRSCLEISLDEASDINFKVTARPNGRFSDSCVLIGTNTGLNTDPLPSECRRIEYE